MTCALVIGATGYVGRAVVAELRRMNTRTIAHVRFDSKRLGHWREHFAAIGAECFETKWDRDAFADVLRRSAVTHIFLCLGTTFRRRIGRSQSSIPDTYKRVDLGLSVLVIDACVQSGIGPVVVLSSAVGAKATSLSPYWSSRGKLEEYLRSKDLEFAIARPAFITGPGRDELRMAERFGAAFVNVCLMLLALFGLRSLRTRYRSIDAPTLAKGLVAHAQDPSSRNKLLMGESLRAVS